jgi:hypothetical protein
LAFVESEQYSRREFGVVVPPGREGTFEYVFRTAETLEALSYPLVADLLYFSPKKVFRNVVYNATIDLTEKSSVLSQGGPTTLVILIAMIAGIYYYANGGQSSSSFSAPAKAKQQPAEQGTAERVDDWGVTAYKQKSKAPKKTA